MNTQISKRSLFSNGVLSAGIGVSALALLAQRASADTNFTRFAFPATGTPMPRTMPDRIAEVLNVKEFGAVGDGLADDTAEIQACIDAAFGSAATPHGNGKSHLNKAVFFPNGYYKISSPIVLTGVMGAKIFGTNRFGTTIANTSGGSVFTTNGFQYSHVSGMRLKTSGAGVCFDLNYDGQGRWSVSCQSNTFADIFFDSGAYGLRIANGLAPGGAGNAQGSENLVLNCFFLGQTVAGAATFGANACDNTMIGGDFQGCAIGIWMGTGAFETIHGVSFQNLTGVDIQTDSNVGEALSISGCRTESKNFLINNGGINSVISGCSQQGIHQGLGFFANHGSGMHEIIGCNSNSGQVLARYWTNVSIRNSTFGRSDWLSTYQMWGGGNSRVGSVEVVNVLSGGSIYGSAGNHIKSQRLYTNDAGTVITRNLEIEGAALTDATVVYGNGYSTVTISIASPAVFGVPNHGFAAGVPVVFFTDGALPTGLAAGTVYYVIAAGLSTSSFQVSKSASGSAVNTSGKQSGTHSFRVARTFSVGDMVRNSAVAAGGSFGWICTTAGEAAMGGTAVFKALPNIAA